MYPPLYNNFIVCLFFVFLLATIDNVEYHLLKQNFHKWSTWLNPIQQSLKAKLVQLHLSFILYPSAILQLFLEKEMTSPPGSFFKLLYLKTRDSHFTNYRDGPCVWYLNQRCSFRNEELTSIWRAYAVVDDGEIGWLLSVVYSVWMLFKVCLLSMKYVWAIPIGLF